MSSLKLVAERAPGLASLLAFSLCFFCFAFGIERGTVGLIRNGLFALPNCLVNIAFDLIGQFTHLESLFWRRD